MQNIRLIISVLVIFASCVLNAQVGQTLPDWQEGYLDIHAINTGRGESTLYIFPDGTTMLVDAAGSLLSPAAAIPPSPAKPNDSIPSGQVISNYVNHFIKSASNKLNYMLLSHWDPDHMGNYSTSLPMSPSGDFRMGGITEVGAKIRVDKMIDREYPDYNVYTNLKSGAINNQIANYRKFTDWAKTVYGTTVERFDVGKTDQIVLKQNPSKYNDFQVRNIVANGVVWTGNGTGTLNTLPADTTEVEAAAPAENIFSIGFYLTYGKFDYFAGGDLQFNDKSNYSWKDIETPVAKVVTAVDVMKANHHGTSNCNSDALLKKLVPQTVLIHTWRDVQPNPETVGRIYAANIDCKLFTTNMTDANKIRLSDYLSKFYSTQGHIVVRVAPQGLQYTIYVLDDSNEEYKVKERFGPYQCNDAAKGKDVKKHYISFQDNEDLYRFYRYRKNAKPIVQGHRGSIENDLPESSIASMEYVLEQMPAVFEIDPRLTKDSVIIVFHDAALERSSTGKGKVIDHTWAELQQLFLKNEKGEVTKYKIHTLAEILEWARGKTALVLDKKDVPLKMIADIIREHDANNYVINMVRSPEDAKFYYEDDNRRMFSVSIRTPDVFYAYMKAGIPKKQIFACIGTEITKETPKLCRLLRKNGIRCLMATAASYDKLDTSEKRAQAYRNIIKNGATIMESNYPVEAGKALSITKPTQE